MANRTEILDRAREIMAQYKDEQVMVWMFMNPKGDTLEDLNVQFVVPQLLVHIRDQLVSEFRCSSSTANSQIAKVVSERNKKILFLARMVMFAKERNRRMNKDFTERDAQLMISKRDTSGQ